MVWNDGGLIVTVHRGTNAWASDIERVYIYTYIIILYIYCCVCSCCGENCSEACSCCSHLMPSTRLILCQYMSIEKNMANVVEIRATLQYFHICKHQEHGSFFHHQTQPVFGLGPPSGSRKLPCGSARMFFFRGRLAARLRLEGLLKSVARVPGSSPWRKGHLLWSKPCPWGLDVKHR